MNLDNLSEGFQVLREYIIYSNLNFIKLCREFDLYSASLRIIWKTNKNYEIYVNIEILSKENFKNALKLSPLYFTPNNMEQIYFDAPKNERKDVLYEALNLMIMVHNIIIFMNVFKN